MIRFIAVLTLLAGPLWAAEGNSALKRLTLRTDLLGWEAVGRVEFKSGGFCTGALVSTRLVLTAAHCVYDPIGRRRDPTEITFRAGLRDGEAIAERGVARIVAHSAYKAGAVPDWNNVRHDVALMELDDPIPSGTASPFRTNPPVAFGKEVSVVSYAAGREAALSRQRTCNVVGENAGLMAFDCDVYFGSSGAPVFFQDHGPPRIVAIVSSGSRTSEGKLSFGMELPSLISDMKLALRTGRGVWPEGNSNRPLLREGRENRAAGHFVRP